MKADLPITFEDFFAAARKHGLHVQSVSRQRLKVAALEHEGTVLRFFAPELRPLPDGTQINGNIGIALQGANKDGQYNDAVFHYIVNLPEMRRTPRLVRTKEDWDEFFQLLLPVLNALPSTPEALGGALRDSTSWMGKQLIWGRANAIEFQRRVRDLADR